MFLNFGKGIISSGVILSSVVSFASSASAQNRLDMSEDCLDLREYGIHKAKDEEAAPSFEDIQNSDEGETLLARESNEEIGSGDSLNVDPSSTKFAKLRKMGKNVVEKVRKLSPVDVALGTVAMAGIGGTAYFKNKNDKVSDQRDQLEKVVQEKEQKIIALSKDGTESSDRIVNLENSFSKLNEQKSQEIKDLNNRLNAEQDKFIKFEEEKAKEGESLNKEIKDLTGKLDAEKNNKNELQKELNEYERKYMNLKQAKSEGWIWFIIKTIFTYSILKAIIKTGKFYFMNAEQEVEEKPEFGEKVSYEGEGDKGESNDKEGDDEEGSVKIVNKIRINNGENGNIKFLKSLVIFRNEFLSAMTLGLFPSPEDLTYKVAGIIMGAARNYS